MSNPLTKDIRFSGLAAVPDQYNAPDGQLDACLNLVPEDAALHPLAQPHTLAQFPEDTRQVFIHRISTKIYNYIALTQDALLYFSIADHEPMPTTPDFTQIDISALPDIDHIDAIGNTLLLFTSEGIHYFLWKPDTHAYLHLGNHLPECALSFGLQAEMKKETFTGINYAYTGFDSPGSGRDCDIRGDETREDFTNRVYGKINKFIAEEVDQKGKFIFPFFVRYAYRLYDGSLTMHSAPVLMIPASDMIPQIFCAKDPTAPAQIFRPDTCTLVAPVCTLGYRFCSSNRAEIELWSDIIKSIDIFVSAPIYPFDQNGEIKSIHFNGPDDSDFYKYGFSVSRLSNQHEDFPSSLYQGKYCHRSILDMYHMAFEPENINKVPEGYVNLPRKDIQAAEQSIRDCSNFYHIHSLEIKDLRPIIEGSALFPINLSKSILPTLVDREAMTDDFGSHDYLMAKYSHVYNSRLNLANLSKRLFNGYHPDSSFMYVDGMVDPRAQDIHQNPDPSIRTRLYDYRVFVSIKNEDRNITVETSRTGKTLFSLPILGPSSDQLNPFYYFFYPDPNAYKVMIVPEKNGNHLLDQIIELPLKPHDSLNGAYFFNGFIPPQPKEEDLPTSSPDPTVSLPNKIYTSEVNNPFLFRAANINTIGTGTILAISSAVKALSQGQFGQFPLYAFTTEGVWALEVSQQGTYSTRQPVTQDICINPAAITQLDSSVLFPTARGIMMIQGSETTCITDPIRTEYPFDFDLLPGYRNAIVDKVADMQTPRRFSEFLSGCGMIYDYQNQHVILYSRKQDINYAYVFSLRSKLWGMMGADFKLTVKAFPDALALSHDDRLVSFGGSSVTPQAGQSDAGRYSHFVLTRPLKLDNPDLLKTVTAVITLGDFARGHVASILYGSRDLRNWHLIRSSVDHYLRHPHGTPYKYFRIALLARLDPDESIAGATIQFTPRLANQPR